MNVEWETFSYTLEKSGAEVSVLRQIVTLDEE